MSLNSKPQTIFKLFHVQPQTRCKDKHDQYGSYMGKHICSRSSLCVAAFNGTPNPRHYTLLVSITTTKIALTSEYPQQATCHKLLQQILPNHFIA
jgi:hypothetical protein